MKSLLYSWMALQMITSIWMFISLFVFGFAETHCATNHMIFGAIVDILRVGTAFHDSYPKERLESKKAVGIEHTKERARNLP